MRRIADMTANPAIIMPPHIPPQRLQGRPERRSLAPQFGPQLPDVRFEFGPYGVDLGSEIGFHPSRIGLCRHSAPDPGIRPRIKLCIGWHKSGAERNSNRPAM
jgi:hypothetical protein